MVRYLEVRPVSQQSPPPHGWPIDGPVPGALPSAQRPVRDAPRPRRNICTGPGAAFVPLGALHSTPYKDTARANETVEAATAHHHLALLGTTNATQPRRSDSARFRGVEVVGPSGVPSSHRKPALHQVAAARNEAVVSSAAITITSALRAGILLGWNDMTLSSPSSVRYRIRTNGISRYGSARAARGVQGCLGLLPGI